MDEPNYKQLYEELVEAICSKSWLDRNKHESVLGVARRLRDSQTKIYASKPSVCTRTNGHKGPCNGLPRKTCW